MAATATRRIRVEKPMAVQTYNDNGDPMGLSAVDKDAEIEIDAAEAQKLVKAHAARFVDSKESK